MDRHKGEGGSRVGSVTRDHDLVLQVHPITTDIINALNKIGMLPPDFEPRAKVKKWLQILNQMRATEELDEDQTRQFLFDLESSHGEFLQWLHNL
jgi:ESCRT-I complex subunit VPS28